MACKRSGVQIPYPPLQRRKPADTAVFDGFFPFEAKKLRLVSRHGVAVQLRHGFTFQVAEVVQRIAVTGFNHPLPSRRSACRETGDHDGKTG